MTNYNATLTKEKMLVLFFFLKEKLLNQLFAKKKKILSITSFHSTGFFLQASNLAVSLVSNLSYKKKGANTDLGLSLNKKLFFSARSTILTKKNVLQCKIQLFSYFSSNSLLQNMGREIMKCIAEARRAKQKTNEKVLVNETSRPKEKNKQTNEKIYTNKTSEALNATKEKLKRHYQSQDKLAPLFDDPEQSIDTCYIRLALLTQQQFQQQKDKM
ncbi:hypothetical protein RFI_32859, partial [Reticulomyxa filosa]